MRVKCLVGLPSSLQSALQPLVTAVESLTRHMPNRGSVRCSRHQCPHWRRCEQDFGGVVEA
jgi:hypothetical protein